MPSEFETVITDQTEYGTIITTQGAAIIADCILNGKKLPIVEAAAGDGGGGGPGRLADFHDCPGVGLNVLPDIRVGLRVGVVLETAEAAAKEVSTLTHTISVVPSQSGSLAYNVIVALS